MIHLHDVSFGYRGHAVIRCKRLDIVGGVCVGIYGANGSGKSTLVRGIAGVLPALSGRVERAANLAIRLVPQRQAIDALWPMTAFDAAAMALSATRRFGWLLGSASRVRSAMERLRIAALAERPFAELSGGQQQRVLLAGALACEPKVLLLDEPAEGLDSGSTEELLAILRGLVNDGMALVMISHEAGELARVADRFAWVEVARNPSLPNELVLLSREAFLDRAIGRSPHAIPEVSP